MFIFFIQLALSDDNSPYTLPIERNKVTHTMVAASWWSGEYPSPVIDVRSEKGKTVTIQAHASLRALTKPRKSCTIESGVYHPWSKGHSTETFYSIGQWVYYDVLADVSDEGLKKGDRLNYETYAAEGYCNYVLVSGKSKKNVQIFCDRLLTKEFKKVETPAHPEEQWLFLRCKEGYKAFIQDRDLSAQTGNVEGNMCGYGVVTSKAEGCSTEPPE